MSQPEVAILSKDLQPGGYWIVDPDADEAIFDPGKPETYMKWISDEEAAILDMAAATAPHLDLNLGC